jgi:hypothetical protein
MVAGIFTIAADYLLFLQGLAHLNAIQPQKTTKRAGQDAHRHVFEESPLPV